MKKILVGALFLAVLIGAASCRQTAVSQALREESPVMNSNVLPSPNNSIEPLQIEDSAAENDLPEPTPTPHKIKLLMTGDFHGEDVEAKSGKNWIGLYRKNNKYFLLPTTVKIRAVRDYLASENSNDRSGRKVSTNYKLPDVFLLKNAALLRQGEVKTLFDGRETDSDGIDRKYRREFKFNGKKYTLAVEDSSAEDGDWLTEKSRMTIASGKLKQTIYTPEYCSDCSWNLCWVGDLDRDGKPDFFLNLTEHYNVTVHRLFLSSQAGKGEIVREVADFGTVGC